MPRRLTPEQQDAARERRKRWIREHPEKAREYKRRNYAKTQGGKATGERWTPAEIRAITEDGRPSDTELAQRLGRSVMSIQVKRSRWTGGTES